jgi:chaperonin GroES
LYGTITGNPKDTRRSAGDGVSSVFQHGAHVVRRQARPAVEEAQLDQNRDAHDLAAEVGHEIAAGFHGAARGQKIVNHQNAMMVGQGVSVDFQRVVAVFEGIGAGLAVVGQLAGFADRDEPGVQRLGDGNAEDEPARLGSDDQIDMLLSVRVRHELDGEGKAGSIGEQRRDVLEDDAGLGKVGNLTDQWLKCAVHGERVNVQRSKGQNQKRIRRGYHDAMAEAKPPQPRASKFETVEPIGKRVLIRKDEDKKQTKSGIHLPDKIEIPTLTGRVVAISAMVENDKDYPIKQYDRVLFAPKQAIPVDFEGDNRLFVIPVEDVVAVFRKEA